MEGAPATVVDLDAPIERARVSVLECLRMDRNAQGAEEAYKVRTYRTGWHESARGRDRPEGVKDVLRWFDEATAIVAFDGRQRDMMYLRKYYEGDMDRWERHVSKLIDPAEVADRKSVV